MSQALSPLMQAEQLVSRVEQKVKCKQALVDEIKVNQLQRGSSLHSARQASLVFKGVAVVTFPEQIPTTVK